ncbi:integral membrane [Pyrrhoderma noxium]|uniref:Integral membrane n=1 Tax=Pyrrhoderma noxium TaxID=2282107 RepID=A0A286UBG6_9AGAM|nr:integral membrane [Pyrrhoderma noxium]
MLTKTSVHTYSTQTSTRWRTQSALLLFSVIAAMAIRHRLSAYLFALAISAVPVAYAHGHHAELTDEERNAPIDAILWIHMLLQCAVWGILFPLGMVLGMSRSRWHVPLQSVGFALTIGGYFLGHSHKGRMFPASIHGSFARFLYIPIAAQLALGVYLKLHIHEQTLRPWAVKAHGIVGKIYPILGWTQMLFGAITLRGYCRDGNLGQCLAHYIMGSAFIAYGIILAVLLLAGEAWIRRSGKSPEWWDSWVIMLWGIVNTFTEHHGKHWSHKDMQHTSLGVVWWAGGALGIWLSRNNQRSVVPSIIVILTGWAMSEHAQALELSTKVHSVFGYTLLLAGVTRIIEVCFIAPTFEKDSLASSSASSDSDRHSERTLALSTSGLGGEKENPRIAVAHAFRHFPPFLLIAAGFLFMSATDEEIQFIHSIDMDHVTYVLLLLSLAFVLYTFVLVLINTWGTSGRHASSSSSAQNSPDSRGEGDIELNKWYQRVPAGVVDGEGEEDARLVSPQFVIGEEQEHEEGHGHGHGLGR